MEFTDSSTRGSKSTTNNASTPVIGHLLLRGAEVAETLGISRALAYRWMAGGVLPVVRRGRSIRVPREALLRWIEENTQQPEAQ